MRLVHYSIVQHLDVFSIEQDRPQHHKPRGLWISDEDDYGWSQWCRAEQYGDIDSDNAFAIELNPDARILWITTPAELVAFDATERYHVAERLPQFGGGGGRWRLNWAAVADEYQGIVITPYQWQHRLNIGWYYSWDCASGCVWDASAVASVVPLALAPGVLGPIDGGLAHVVADRLGGLGGGLGDDGQVVVGHADVDGVAAGVLAGASSGGGHDGEITVSATPNKVETAILAFSQLTGYSNAHE